MSKTVPVNIRAFLFNPPYMRHVSYNNNSTVRDLKAWVSQFDRGIANMIGINIVFKDGTSVDGINDTNLIRMAANNPSFSHYTAWAHITHGGRKIKRKTKRKTKRKKKRKTKRKIKRKTKRKHKKRRTRNKRGRGPMFSKPARVATVGALALGMGAEAVSPAAKQTYQEIMRADCNAPFRQMVMPHHPDKGGNIDDFSFVESARQSRKGNCGPNTQTTKPKPPSGTSRKKWNQQQRGQRRQAKEEAIKQSERQEEADARASKDNSKDDTEQPSNTLRNVAAAAAIGLGGVVVRNRLRGDDEEEQLPPPPRPPRPRTPPRNR